MGKLVDSGGCVKKKRWEGRRNAVQKEKEKREGGSPHTLAVKISKPLEREFRVGEMVPGLFNGTG